MIDTIPQKVLIARAIWDLPSPGERKEGIVQYLEKSYPHYKPIRTERPFVLCEDTRKAGKK
ncbi:hypothetical protein D7M11_26245 [Paenibacillus ginsengarvi]|uniref:Uncharacterized protein n=1 Tax=Paenibacillus ginsengarvi TaxID=400777 RepID=A0A3B0BSQ0_9BACL|nr:hypothetical protein D7M11_26245 [Paenibacillus ginsengarvi]